jgi:molecular chaperone DnaJ
VTCGTCKGTGAEGGSEPQTCPTCSGIGKVRAQQGFFTVERTCPTCNGLGQTIKNPCKTCQGAGRVEKEKTLSVNIPAGVETGHAHPAGRRGRGRPARRPHGRPLHLRRGQEHAIFARDGADLHCRVPVSMVAAALGGDIEVPTIDGGRARVKIPEGSQTGRQMRLRGKGMPALRSKDVGDMFIELVVETPVSLTSKPEGAPARVREARRGPEQPPELGLLLGGEGFWDSMKG